MEKRFNRTGESDAPRRRPGAGALRHAAEAAADERASGRGLGLVASMYIGNVMLLILNLPLAPAFAGSLRVPYEMLIPVIFDIALLALLYPLIGWTHARLNNRAIAE